MDEHRHDQDQEGRGLDADVQPGLLPKMHISSLPMDAAEQAEQAAAAIEAAFRDGMRRQCVELLLLQPETGQDDWPGGIRQQWRVAQPLVETILRTIKKADALTGPLSAEIWDQGDAVAAWTGEKLAAVLFPTAASMDQVGGRRRCMHTVGNPPLTSVRIDLNLQLKAVANKAVGGPDLLLVVNPQWETRGLAFGQSGELGHMTWPLISSLLSISMIWIPPICWDQILVLDHDALKVRPLWEAFSPVMPSNNCGCTGTSSESYERTLANGR